VIATANQAMSRDHFRDAGYWLDKTVDQLLTEAAARTPDKVSIVADRADRDQARRLTYRELEDLAERAASSLRKLGIGPGDVVTVQLPNWWEFVVTAFACSRIGAIMNPVMPILRERELLYILNFCEAKVFIVPKLYRGFDYSAMARGMLGGLPHLKHLIVVDGDGDSSFERALLAAEPAGKSAGLRPDDMSVLMFTSGTTGEPKGVIHTSNSLVGCCKALTERFGLDASDVLLVASPVGHMTGYAAIVLLSVYLGGTMVLQDLWEPRHGVSLMAREGVTYTAASTPFLSDICDTVKAGAPPHRNDRRLVRRRADSVGVDRARRKRAWHQGMLAVGNDGNLGCDPHRTVARIRQVTDHRWAAAGRHGSSHCRFRRKSSSGRPIGASAGSRLSDVQGLLQET
jgi:cyclohexanecarboxylate-CoA ligase